MPKDSVKAEPHPTATDVVNSSTLSGSVILFFLATYGLTWVCWIGVLAAHISVQAPIGELLVLIGTFAPAFMSLWFTWKYQRSAGLHSLVGRMLKWQVGTGWYLFAIAYLPVIKLSAAAGYRLITGTWPGFGTEPWYIMTVAVIFSTPVQSGEELGWRGYALPRLAERMGFAWGSVVLGIIWASWHLPIFFIPGADKYGQSFPVWAAAVTAVSVALAYVYAKTGSLLLTMLMHAAINNTSGIVPATQPGASNPFSFKTSLVLRLTTGLMWIAAVYFLLRMPRLSSHPAASRLRSATD